MYPQSIPKMMIQDQPIQVASQPQRIMDRKERISSQEIRNGDGMVTAEGAEPLKAGLSPANPREDDLIRQKELQQKNSPNSKGNCRPLATIRDLGDDSQTECDAPRADYANDCVDAGAEAEGTQPAKKGNLFGSPYKRRDYIYAICVAVLLSFNAGYINGSCLSGLVSMSGRKVVVSAPPGTLTASALTLAGGDVQEYGFLACMILTFFLGSFFAGILAPNTTPYRIDPSYGPAFLLGALVLIISSTLAALEIEEDQFIFYLASFANGIQNGISSIYSEKLIRSTGLTGTLTDIGIFLGQHLRGNRKNTWKLVVLLSLLTSFWIGGLISFYATTKFTQFSLLASAALFLLIGFSVIGFLTLQLHVSFGAAISGKWQWKRGLDHLITASVHRPSHTGISPLDEVFDRVDTDGNGALDVLELRAALRQAGVQVSKREVALMIKRADKQGKGTVSREEFRRMATSCSDPTSRTSMQTSMQDLINKEDHRGKTSEEKVQM